MDLISARTGIVDLGFGSSPAQMANPKVGVQLLPKGRRMGKVGARLADCPRAAAHAASVFIRLNVYGA